MTTLATDLKLIAWDDYKVQLEKIRIQSALNYLYAGTYDMEKDGRMTPSQAKWFIKECATEILENRWPVAVPKEYIDQSFDIVCPELADYRVILPDD